MATYLEITAGSFSDVCSGVQIFLKQNGWTINNNNFVNGLTSFAAVKYDTTLQFRFADNTTLYNGTVTFTNGAVRMYFDAYSTVRSVAALFTYPMRCLFFELAGNSIMLSFEIGGNKWAHVLCANIVENPNGITKFVHSTHLPFQTRSGAFAVSTDIDIITANSDSCHGNRSLGNQFLSAVKCWYWNDLSTSGYIEYYSGSSIYVPIEINGVWDTSYTSSNVISTVNNAPEKGNTLSNSNAHWINKIGRNMLTGTPVLYPIVYVYTQDKPPKYLFQVPDIYACAASACKQGEKFSLGSQQYFALPFGEWLPNAACMAVRCN